MSFKFYKLQIIDSNKLFTPRRSYFETLRVRRFSNIHQWMTTLPCSTQEIYLKRIFTPNRPEIPKKSFSQLGEFLAYRLLILWVVFEQNCEKFRNCIKNSHLVRQICPKWTRIDLQYRKLPVFFVKKDRNLRIIKISCIRPRKRKATNLLENICQMIEFLLFENRPKDEFAWGNTI